MRILQWVRACLGATSVLLCASIQAAALAQLPRFDDLDLSPDGTRLAMVRAGSDVYNLVVRELTSGRERTLYEGGLKSGLINWCRWANNTRLLCSTRTYLPMPRIGFVTRTRMFAVDADGSGFLPLISKVRNMERRPVRYDAQVQDRILSWLTDDPEHVLVQLNRERPNRPTAYRLNIYTNHLSMVQRARSNIRRWYATHEGRVRLAVGYRGESQPVVYSVNGRRLTPFEGREFISEIAPQPVGFSADQQSVYMSMTNGEDRHGLYRVALDDRRVEQRLYADPEFDVFGSIISNPDTGEPAGVSYLAHHPKLHFFEPKLKVLFEHIAVQLPGSQMRLVSADRAYRHFVLYSYGGVAPRYFLYDRDSDVTTLIGADYPELADEAVIDLKPVRYPTRDGLSVPAYLAVPAAPGPHATVLLPHGGPYARDSAEFDAWTQFLVGQGIAVLKPNYRGSVGYGEAYMQAGYKQWGLKMQQDLMDGLSWLVASGVTDPDRVCVVGASYGGYTALVSSYKFKDRVRCAVSLAGISDLPKMVERLYNFDLVQRNRERIQDGNALVANSPLHQVQAIRVPVLMVHGDMDTVVRVRQSRRLAAALERAGRDFRYVEQTGGDHFLSSGHQRRQFFTEMQSFLAQHLLAARP